MKKYKCSVIFLLTIFVIASCKPKDNDIEADYIAASIGEIHVDSKYNWVVILPSLGCHGCIQEGEAFMQEYIGNENILFVLTKIESLKILQKKIKINIKEYDNIYIDKNRTFHIPTDNSIYPCIVEVEKGHIKAHEFQSPKNSAAFQKLKKCITSDL